MINFPREVRPDEGITATKWNELVRCLRAIAIIPSPGVNPSTGPNGTRLAVAPAAKPASAPEDRSCFKIVKIQQPDGEDYVKVMMTNCYFVAGSVPTFVPDIPPPGGDEEQQAEYEAYPWPEVPTSGEYVVFLCVRFQYDGSRAFEFDAWRPEAFFDVSRLASNEFHVPLYLFRDGKLAVDLRNAPRIQAWEIQEETRQ